MLLRMLRFESAPVHAPRSHQKLWQNNETKMKSHYFLQDSDVSQNYRCILKLMKYTLFAIVNKRALTLIRVGF